MKKRQPSKQSSVKSKNKSVIKTVKSSPKAGNIKLKTVKDNNSNNGKNAANYYQHTTFRPVKHDSSIITNNIETLFACSDLMVKTGESISNQIVTYINNLFADNIEVSKDFFKCTTIEDMVDLQEKLFHANWYITMYNMDKINSSLQKCNSQLESYMHEKMHDNMELLNEGLTRHV